MRSDPAGTSVTRKSATLAEVEGTPTAAVLGTPSGAAIARREKKHGERGGEKKGGLGDNFEALACPTPTQFRHYGASDEANTTTRGESKTPQPKPKQNNS